MSTRTLLGVALGLLVCVTRPLAGEAAAERPALTGVVARLDGEQVQVSFGLTGVPGPEDVERIRSGLGVTHRHRIELRSRRTLPLWPARTHARLRVEASAKYDSLTRQYELTRVLELGGGDRQPTSRIDRRTTDRFEEACLWLSRFDDLPALELPAEGSRERLRVHVESSLDRRYLLYLIPSRLTVSAETALSP